eukprot:scaffold24268_cov99-Isochrysis_galbana.AAC.4
MLSTPMLSIHMLCAMLHLVTRRSADHPPTPVPGTSPPPARLQSPPCVFDPRNGHAPARLGLLKS